MRAGDYIRRLGSHDYIRGSGQALEIKFAAFKCSKRDEDSGGLSWTQASPEMISDRCEDYWNSCSQDHESGGKKTPALCYLTAQELERQGLRPIFEEDKADVKYGKQHYQTPCVDHRTDDGKRILKNLAHHASKNGIVRPLIHPQKGIIPKDFGLQRVGRETSLRAGETKPFSPPRYF